MPAPAIRLVAGWIAAPEPHLPAGMLAPEFYLAGVDVAPEPRPALPSPAMALVQPYTGCCQHRLKTGLPFGCWCNLPTLATAWLIAHRQARKELPQDMAMGAGIMWRRSLLPKKWLERMQRALKDKRGIVMGK